MKKSIKKACSVALILTSTVALTGASALAVEQTIDNTNTFIHADQEVDTLTMLKIPAYDDTALLGETYPIPAAQLWAGESNITSANPITTTVKDSIGRAVDIDGNAFVVNGIGTYTITYSVNYGGTDYSTSIEVNASVSENHIEVVENTNRTLPGDVYQSYTGNIYIPNAQVIFADEDLAQEYEITTTVTSPSQENITFNQETGLLNVETLEEGTYTVRYTAHTTSGIYLDSTTVEFTVLSDTAFESKYGDTDYTLSFEYSSTVPTSADIGDELVLPQAIGSIGDQQTPVYYTVQAFVYIDGRTHEVTNQTISTNEDDRYVFTAQKKYTIGGQEYTVTNGRYQFYYNVTDALGKTAERDGFIITGVKDTQKPEVIITDPYTIGDENITSKSYKLQNNFQTGQNIILKAMYAEDLSDDLSELTMVRYIRKTTQSSTEQDIYTDANSEVENVFTKDIVFNKSSDYVIDPSTQIDGGTLENGTYRMYYRATDSAGNVTTETFTFEVDNTFEFTSDTTIEFQDTFPISINKGDRVTFTSPLATNDDDERLETRIYYKFDNSQGTGWDAWTLLELNEDGSYVIPTDVDGATSLTIRAMAISDAPTTALETAVDESADISTYEGKKYGFDEVTISIRDSQDQEVPQIVTLGDWESEYHQNDDITLPTLTLEDDLLEYVDVDVKITHLDEESDETQAFYAENAVLATIGGQKTFSGATFYANLAGRYDIIYEITDAANNKICVFQSINVLENETVSQPHFGNLPEQLNGGTLEFGQSLTLPIPQLPNENYDYNVNVRGPVGSQINKETFTPKREGTYTVVYTLYHKDSPEVALDTKEFVLEVSDATAPTVRVEWNLNDSYAVGSRVLIPVFSASDVSGINLKDSTIVISSNSFRREISGDEVANLYEQYLGWLAEEEQIAQGTLESHSAKYATAGDLYVTLNYNEVYTVTYTIYDNSTSRRSAVVTRTIRVGDLVDPTIILPENFVPTTVKIDDNTPLTFDTKGITVTDTDGEGNRVEIDSSRVTITVRGPNGNLDNVHTDNNGDVINDGVFEFMIDTAGEYTVTIRVLDDAGNDGEIVRTFTVNELGISPLSDNEIITIVLICVAVLVLAGAVVYAIISSKNTKAYKQ